MRFLERATIGILVFLGLIGLHQAVAVFMNAHAWKGLAPSDWAAWVQAVGSIAAIWGAVWISNRDQRAKKQDAVAIAVLAAAEHWTGLQDTIQNLRTIAGRLKHAEALEPAPSEWISMLKALQDRPKITSETLAKFLALEGECGVRMAYASADMRTAEIHMGYLTGGVTHPKFVRDAELQLLILTINRAISHLDLAMIPIIRIINPDIVDSEW